MSLIHRPEVLAEPEQIETSSRRARLTRIGMYVGGMFGGGIVATAGVIIGDGVMIASGYGITVASTGVGVWEATKLGTSQESGRENVLPEVDPLNNQEITDKIA